MLATGGDEEEAERVAVSVCQDAGGSPEAQMRATWQDEEGYGEFPAPPSDIVPSCPVCEDDAERYLAIPEHGPTGIRQVKEAIFVLGERAIHINV